MKEIQKETINHKRVGQGTGNILASPRAIAITETQFKKWPKNQKAINLTFPFKATGARKKAAIKTTARTAMMIWPVIQRASSQGPRGSKSSSIPSEVS